MLLLYFIAAGLLIGRLLGGRFDAVGDVRFRWWGVAVGGLAVQLVLFSAPVASRVGAAGPPLYVLSTAAVLIALLRNLSLPGFVVIAAGAGLNLLAIVANGGYMPSSTGAWEALNGVAALPTTAYSNSALAASGTLVPFLGDIFALPRPLPLANVFSIGDVLIGVGCMLFLVRTMRAVASVLADRRPVDGVGAGGLVGPVIAPQPGDR